MKPIAESHCDDQVSHPLKTAPPGGEPEVPWNFETPKLFRRLKGNELVSRGDFIMGAHHAIEPWEGPTGFRADAFVKPIYRSD
jgi:hypothetical protein